MNEEPPQTTTAGDRDTLFPNPADVQTGPFKRPRITQGWAFPSNPTNFLQASLPRQTPPTPGAEFGDLRPPRRNWTIWNMRSRFTSCFEVTNYSGVAHTHHLRDLSRRCVGVGDFDPSFAVVCLM